MKLPLRFVAVAFGLWLTVAAAQPSENYRLKHAVTVGMSDNPVQLKAGDIVEVLRISGPKAIISVAAADGSKAIYQINAEALEPVPAATATAPAKPFSPMPPSPPQVAQTASPAVPSTSDNPFGAAPVIASTSNPLDGAVVVIKGDVAEGTGFLVKTPTGPAVVTNLHVISANPHAKIWSTNGTEIKIVSLKGATDRDLAMFTVQDDHARCLDVARNVGEIAQTGDEVITPGNSHGGEVVLTTKGEVRGVGPVKVEFSNPIYHGNSGGPVYHTKSGKVLAVVTQAMRVKTNNDIDKASHANKNSAISGDMRYFGLRLDTVPQWETYDWNRFLIETTFLKKFHDLSVCLDSFMNGSNYEKRGIASADGMNGPPDSHYFLRNEKLRLAGETYHRQSADTVRAEQLDAVRQLVMQLQGIAGTDLPAIQTPTNFYTYDQQLAKEEAEYRKALMKEIDTLGDRIGDLGH